MAIMDYTKGNSANSKADIMLTGPNNLSSLHFGLGVIETDVVDWEGTFGKLKGQTIQTLEEIVSNMKDRLVKMKQIDAEVNSDTTITSWNVR